MAFQAPVNVQNILSATTELWPSMFAVVQSPWRGFSRTSASGGSGRRVEAKPSSVDVAPTPKSDGQSSLCLPEALSSVPISALRPTALSGAMLRAAAPTIAGTLSSVPQHALRYCTPFAQKLPMTSMMARQYSTASRNGSLSKFQPIPRIGQIGLGLVPRRSLFINSTSIPGSKTPLTKISNALLVAERYADKNPDYAAAQNALYKGLLNVGLPGIVVERYESGRFAANARSERLYKEAVEAVEKADQVQSLSPQVQAVGQAVGAHVGGGTLGRARAGSGLRADPLYVVIEESVWSNIFKWVRWILTFGLTTYIALVLITLFVETSGVFRKVGGGASSQVKPEHQTTRFSDVHGCDEAKEELQDVVDFLKNPERYNKLGGRLPKGVLLVGPPGTGKTLLARAVAGEAGVPFFYMSGSEFDEVYVGVGAKRVRELFTTARQKAPAIVFIDELDAIGGKRTSREANYHRQTLNQLLNDLDGFDQSTGVIFIAATNHPQILDKALTRPGRFDRHVAVDLPDVRGRMAILQHHMKKIRTSPEVDISTIARGTPGFSGAELENLANTAAVRASKNKNKFVTLDDLEWAKDKILMGAEKRSRVVQMKDKLHTAYHEGGHTLVGLYTKGVMDLHKATILPRGPANGITFFLPKDSTHKSKQEYFADLQVSMGGKLAEEIVYGEGNVSSGASGDIQSATNQAYAMVTMFGFSDRMGNVDYNNNYNHISEDSKKQIDSEVRRLIDEARDQAKKLLLEHRKELDLLAQALVQYETLDKEEVLKVIKGEKLPNRLMATDSPIKLPELPIPPQIKPPTPSDPDEPSGGVPA